jgi:hypothetical protein
LSSLLPVVEPIISFILGNSSLLRFYGMDDEPSREQLNVSFYMDEDSGLLQ